MKLSDLTKSFSEWFCMDGADSNSTISINLVSLEDRVLYSAVPIPIDLLEPTDPAHLDSGDAANTVFDPIETISVAVHEFGSLESYDQHHDLSLLPVVDDVVSDPLNPDSTYEVIFVDQSVEDFDALVDDILSRADETRHFEVVVVKQDIDGISQISDYLSSSGKIFDSLHLVTHGSDGQLRIGATTLDSASIEQYGDQLAGWDSALTMNADLLIYGCNVAASEMGESFVDLLSHTIGVDVAASDDVTGNALHQGNWQFEYFVGTVESNVAFTIELQSNWTHSLNINHSSESGAASRAVGGSDDGVIVVVGTQESGGQFDVIVTRTNQMGEQLGPTQVVNDTTVGDQQWASVAVAGDGSFVVVWTSDHPGEQGVFAKLYDTAGVAIGTEFRVDPVGTGGNDASVAMDASGNFVVAWEGSGDGNPLTVSDDPTGIYGQRFSGDGTRIGNVIVVNQNTAGQQGNADVAVNASGEFVVAWDNYISNATESNVSVRQFDASGNGGTEVTAFSFTSQVYSNASVDINSSGDFVVAATSDATDAAKAETFTGAFATAVSTSVVGRYYESDLSSNQFMFVNQTSYGRQQSPSVAIFDDDTIVFTWEGRTGVNSMSDQDGVYIRSFDTSGTAINSEAYLYPSDTSGVDGQVSLAKFAGDSEFIAGFNSDGTDFVVIQSALVNQRPVGIDSSVTTNNFSVLTFQSSDFASADPESVSTQKIRIESIPNLGTLLLSGVAVSIGDEIDTSEIAAGNLTYRPPVGVMSSTAASFTYSPSDGVYFSNSPATLNVNIQFEPSLLFSHKNAQSGGPSEIPSWEESEVIRFGGSGLQFDDGVSTTEGEISRFFNFETFLAGSNIDGFHYVSTATTVGSTALQAGDVLFSLKNDGLSFGDLVGTADSEDIILFRPDDITYSSGTFSVLVDMSRIDGQDIKGFTLVEHDTLIGEQVVRAGDFLIAGIMPAGPIRVGETPGDSIHLLSLTQTGLNTTAGSNVRFINGDDVGIDRQITGIELIEQQTFIGGVNLSSGSFLLSVQNNENVGSTVDVNVTTDDIFILNVSRTSMVGTAAGEATLFFVGDDPSISTLRNADIDAISLVVNHVVQDTPTDLSTGIQINSDGGNDLYFAVNDANPTDLLNGFQKMTVETTVSISEPPTQWATLFNYHVGGSDEFSINVRNNGRLRIDVAGNSIVSSNLYPQLLDGLKHHIAVSWNSDGGILQIFVDGQFVETKSNVSPGQSLLSNGVLVLGQDQDSPNGNFDPNQTFKGTMFDVRIWDEDRTEAEIAANYLHKFDSDTIPDKLVANWQMNQLLGNTSHTIVDLVNPGTHDLSVLHIGNTGPFSNSSATDSLNIPENASAGDLVGFIVPTDDLFIENIVEDGLFNSNFITDSDYTTFAYDGSEAGNQLGAWTVVANAIDVRGSDWELSPLGGQVVDLAGGNSFGVNGPGTIEQHISTEVGRTYEISFAMSGNFEATGSTQHRLSVNVDGNSNMFSFDKPPGWNRNNLQWNQESLTFTATSTTTVLQFEALTGTFRGALIGDVQVIESSPTTPADYSYTMLDNAGGRFAINASSGAITVLDGSLLDYESNSSHQVTIRVTDSAGGSYVERLTIEVNDTNDSPTVATNSTLTVSEGSSGNVISSSHLNEGDVDDDGVELTYEIITAASHGTVRLSGAALRVGDTFTQADIDAGRISYDHSGSETISDSFGFRLTDGGEDGATPADGVFQVNVNPVNDAPASADKTVIMLEDGTYAFSNADFDFMDADIGDTMAHIKIKSLPTLGELKVNGGPAAIGQIVTVSDLASGRLTYKPVANDFGNNYSSFGFVVNDGKVDSNTTNQININVTPVQDAPSATNHGITTAEDVAINGDLSPWVSDVDPADVLQFATSPVVPPLHGNVVIDANGTFTYTPNANYNGSDSFTYRVTDGNGGFATAIVNISITPVDDPLVAFDDNYSVVEDGTLSANVLVNDSDVDGGILTVNTTPLSGPSNGMVLLNSDGSFTYIPDADFEGSDAFVYQVVSSADGETRSATVRIAVTPVNDAPSVTLPNSVNVLENTTAVVSLSASDVDGPTLNFSITGPDAGRFTILPGNMLALNSSADFENPNDANGNGIYEIFIVANDGSDSSPAHMLHVVIIDAPDNPRAVNDSFTVNEGQRYVSAQHELIANDIDPLALGITTQLLSGPQHGSVQIQADGTFRYVHDGSETLSDSFSYSVIAADGQIDNASVLVTVNPVQDATIVVDDGIFTTIDTLELSKSTLLANDIDPDSTSFEIRIVSAPTMGSATINGDGNLVFVPNATDQGITELEYVVVADGIISNPGRVVIDVAVPDPTQGQGPSPVPPQDDIQESEPTEDVSESEEIDPGGVVTSNTADSTNEDDHVYFPRSTTADYKADVVESDSIDYGFESARPFIDLSAIQETYGYGLESRLSLAYTQAFARVTGINAGAISTFDPLILGAFWDELDSTKREFLMKFEFNTPTIAASVTSFLTVGYLAWIVRGGVLLTTFMSSIPAWQWFDPLPVIESANAKEDDDDQSIAEMVDN